MAYVVRVSHSLDKLTSWIEYENHFEIYLCQHVAKSIFMHFCAQNDFLVSNFNVSHLRLQTTRKKDLELLAHRSQRMRGK